MFTKAFWLAAAERAAKSAANSLLLFTGMAQQDWLHFDWTHAGASMVGGAVVSVAMSLASLPIGPANDPGVV